MKVMNLLDRLSGKVRRRTIVKRSSEWRGTIADSESLRRALEGKSLTNVGIIAREGREMRSLSQLVQNKGAKVVFQHVLTDNCEDVDLSNIDQVEQIVLAVFDTAVYRLRYRILQSLRGGTTEIIAPAYPYQPLVEDDWFNKIITNLADKTEWDVAFWQSWKSYGVYQLLRLALRLEGDCYEFGCYRGYSAAFLAETMQVLNVRNKKIVLFDTWEGMPSSDKAADSFYRSGDFADTALETVQRALKPWQDRFEYIQGDICQTLPLQRPRPLCYARIDVDLYAPARVALETIYDWVVEGGIVYLDDYVSEKTVGERLAVDEVLADRPERPFYMLGDRAYIIKGVD